MSEAMDISAKSKANSKPKGGGSRFLFTIAITTAICLSILCFLWILGRSTQDTGPRLSIEPRSADQIFSAALVIPEKPLRLRALRNFSAAFPDSSRIDQSLLLIKELEAEEYESWLTLSDIFYTVSATPDEKQKAVMDFQVQWGTGTYREELSAMNVQFSGGGAHETDQAPALPQAMREDAAEMDPGAPLNIDDYLVGGPPRIEIYEAAKFLPKTPPAPTIIAASIKDDVQPSYPSRAESRGIEAVVTVSMDIDAEGRVKDAYIVRPATGRYATDFGRAAVRAAEKTRFIPKTIDGAPAPTNGFTRRYRFEIAQD